MNFCKKMIATGKVILAASFLLTLTACQQDIALLDADNVVVGNGTLEFSANSPPSMLQSTARSFQEPGARPRVYEAGVAKRHRLIGSRSYEAYMQGNTPDSLRHGRAILTAEDGSEMVCDFYYRTQPKSGNCSVDGNVLKLVLSG